MALFTNLHLVAGFKRSGAISLFPLWAFMACFRVKCTSQKTRCICISETDQSVSSREVVSIIYVGSCKMHRMCCVGTLQSFKMLNGVVGMVMVVLESLNLLFQFCSGQQWVRHSY
jgi:hypothetical protein